MKTVLVMIAALAVAAASISTPITAAAQPPGASWRGDVCHQEKRAAGSRGTFLGALFGGVFGSAVAGRGNRAAGAVIGGTAGAVTGHAITENSVQCEPYPGRVEAHDGACHWVGESHDGAQHQFEVCREPDGVWRPSGRS